jgi:TP53 regulating kinase-like protein
MEGFSLFKQGAEARLHVGTFLGQRAIAKERFAKKYRHPTLDQQLTKKRLKAELKLIMRCKKIGVRTPTVYMADAEKSVFIMEYLEEADTCRDFINRYRSSAVGNEKVRLEKVLHGIGSTLAKLHNDGVIHGDLTTSNILVDRDELVRMIHVWEQ